MRILIAPDKFKNSLTADEAARAIREGFSRVFFNARYDLAPIADGGEGTAAVFRNSEGGEVVKVPAHDALGRPIDAAYSWFPEKKLAVIEMSQASGLWRLLDSETDPLRASTLGTGELMAHALAQGAETLVVALGGSATNDGGAGMASALGWKFLDFTDNEMSPRGGNLSMIRKVVRPSVSLLPTCKVRALCDVTNPLLGTNGATRVYGAQKGATPETAENLETALTHLADLCRDQLDSDFRDYPGAGAAGGLGFGLLTFCDAVIEQGFETVSGILGLRDKVIAADLVVTGEGQLDAQSLHGKGPVEVARMAREEGRPVIAFAGKVEGAFAAFDACIPIADGPLSLEESRLGAADLLRAAAERTAQLLSLRIKKL